MATRDGQSGLISAVSSLSKTFSKRSVLRLQAYPRNPRDVGSITPLQARTHLSKPSTRIPTGRANLFIVRSLYRSAGRKECL
jgi:hypothetical protein